MLWANVWPAPHTVYANLGVHSINVHDRFSLVTCIPKALQPSHGFQGRIPRHPQVQPCTTHLPEDPGPVFLGDGAIPLAWPTRSVDVCGLLTTWPCFSVRNEHLSRSSCLAHRKPAEVCLLNYASRVESIQATNWWEFQDFVHLL